MQIHEIESASDNIQFRNNNKKILYILRLRLV